MDSDSPLIVAVACFAGDNAAPSELVSALPADCAVALVFVEQPSTVRASVLAEALVKRTALPVISAHEGLVVEQGLIYVIPENSGLTMTRGRIHAIWAPREFDCLADSLFVSLAHDSGDQAIGVILSGGGSDRAFGIRAIRRAGGTTFAQYPGSARFPNLPISAIDTGCVDFVLRPNELAYELARVSRHKEKVQRGTSKHVQITQLGPILTGPVQIARLEAPRTGGSGLG
jgi:two-component system, chemotaxis family, CheB/CheR fusion protein